MASRLGRRRATQFQSRWVAEYPARAQRLAVMVQRLVREPPSGRGAVRTLFGGWTVALLTEADLGVRGIFMRRALRHWRAAAAGLPPGLWQLCDVARLRAELETRTAALERQARCYELDVAAAKATLLLVSHRVHEPRLRAELAERCERLPSFDPRPLLGDVAGAARREAFLACALPRRHAPGGAATYLEVSRDCELVARPCAACRGVLTASWRRSKHVEDALISEERHRHTEDALSTALYRLDALRDEARALWKRCETAEDARAPLEAHAAKRNEEVRTLRRDAFKAQRRYRASPAHGDLKGDLAAGAARRRPRGAERRPTARARGLRAVAEAGRRPGLDAAVRLRPQRAEAGAASRWRGERVARRGVRPRRGGRGLLGRGGRRRTLSGANGGARWEAEVRVVEIVREVEARRRRRGDAAGPRPPELAARGTGTDLSRGDISGLVSAKADAEAARAAAAAELEATDRALAKTKRTLAARERELKDCKQEAKRACHLADRSRGELAQVRVVHKQGVKAAREEERAVADRLASSYAHKVEGLWWLVGVQRRVAAAAATYAEASRKAHKALVDDLRDLGGDDGFADREPEFREAPRDRLRRIFRTRAREVASRCSVARVANDYGLVRDADGLLFRAVKERGHLRWARDALGRDAAFAERASRA
ncbi:hypothetical protein JL721_2013 [Aureococcus anophagefferens]|nr:hypothetical protein JL721_2013 [Aureococcus anophagefferens]